MKLEVLYSILCDCTQSSHGRDFTSVDTMKTGSVFWDGEDSPQPHILRQEMMFLEAVHPADSSQSYDHRNHRIEVTGLRIGGEKGLVFAPIQSWIYPVKIALAKVTLVKS